MVHGRYQREFCNLQMEAKKTQKECLLRRNLLIPGILFQEKERFYIPLIKKVRYKLSMKYIDSNYSVIIMGVYFEAYPV